MASVAATATSASSINIHDRFRAAKEVASIRPKVLHPLENEGLRLLILENISLEAVESFRAHGWHVDHYAKAMSEDELVDKIGSYHAIGIRSKTKITPRVLKAASKVIPFQFHIFPVLTELPPAPGHRMLLHWHQPGRSPGRRPHRYPGL